MGHGHLCDGGRIDSTLPFRVEDLAEFGVSNISFAPELQTFAVLGLKNQKALVCYIGYYIPQHCLYQYLF